MTVNFKGARADARRIDEAADWFLRLRDDDVGEDELARWFQWCAHPENLKEFERISGVWRGLENPRSGPLPRPERSLIRRAWGTPLSVACAAGLLMVIAVGTLVLPRLFSHPRDFTARSTIHSDVLPDGSRVTLAPRSEVSVQISTTERTVAMATGEAFFRVHPDKHKPFTVTTSQVAVTAVGTAFDVRSESDRVTVTVQEGVVDVSPVGVTGRQRWRVTAGSQISYDLGSHTARISAVEADRLVAWHTGRLEYVATPLGVVVADVTRYSGRVVEIADPALLALTYTGVVLTGAIDDWLAALQTTFPIRLEAGGGGHALLRGRGAGSGPS